MVVLHALDHGLGTSNFRCRNRQPQSGRLAHLPPPAARPGFNGYPYGYRYDVEPPTADHRQAEYFVRLLLLDLQRIDLRIKRCRAAINFATAAGDIENVVGFRELLDLEQAERRTVQVLIANLRTRFSLQDKGEGC